MGLAGRVTKLEQKAWPLLRCLSCQLRAATGWRELKSWQVTSDMVVQKCAYCGGCYEIPLESENKQVREIVKLILEADPIQKYRDEKWHCAVEWLVQRHSQIEIYQRAMASEDEFRFYRPYPPTPGGEGNASFSSGKRNSQIVDLSARAAKFVGKESLKIKRLIKAPESFPIDETVRQIKAQIQDQRYCHIADLCHKLKLHYNLPEELEYQLNACFTHLEILKAREAYELFIWRQSLEVTKTETIFFEQEINNKSAEAIQAIISIEDEKAATENEKPATIAMDQPPQDTPAELDSLDNTHQVPPTDSDQNNIHILMNESSRADPNHLEPFDQSPAKRECEFPETQPPEYRTIQDSSSNSKKYERFIKPNRYRRFKTMGDP